MNLLREIAKNKLSLIALVVLVTLYLAVIFAPFFAPYSYDEDDVLHTHAPPTKIHLFSLKEKVYRPFIYAQKFTVDKYYRRIYAEDKTKIYPIRFFIKGFKYKIFNLWESDLHLFGVEKAKLYLLGADPKGRDILSRIIYGGRISLSIGLIGATISLLIGLLVGGISGYFGGKIDNISM